MGRIVPEVEAGHLAAFPDEVLHLRPFVQNFDVTWAARRRAVDSNLSVYFLKPERHMEREFGFESEILAVYSKYAELQPRSMQAIEQFLSDAPARGRVDTMIAFLISEAHDPAAWTRQYMTSRPESRIIATFSAENLRTSAGDSWAVRSMLAEQLYQRDLFDYRLPINSDYYFFGRSDLLFDLHNAFKGSENRGLFGLRKTGKTSVFFKLERDIKANDDGVFIYIDCKFPPRRTSRWDELLIWIADQLDPHADDKAIHTNSHASDAFVEALTKIDSDKRVALVFDEIEYISFESPEDEHWKQDFIPFWQTIWHAQSIAGNLAVFVGGVNPTVVEKDLIGGTQNPLFGIVSPQYLGGLHLKEVRLMLRTLGRPMGLRFTTDAVNYLFEQYGGHPLLTRLACSVIHRTLRDSAERLPRLVDKDWLVVSEESREAELTYYCGHVVSELKKFYPDEYSVIAEVARGNLADIYEFIRDPMFTTHLKNYGLIRSDAVGRPSISIPSVERYVRFEEAREAGLRTIPRVQPVDERALWLSRRTESIDSALSDLQRASEQIGRPSLFGPNGYPESHKFFDLDIVSDERDFMIFINVCNKCFVESIENYGRSIQHGRYFWSDISQHYPALSSALRRIKVYRHDRVHIRLTDQATEELKGFLQRDLSGRPPRSFPELWFHLQQCVLDDLLICLFVEIDRLT